MDALELQTHFLCGAAALFVFFKDGGVDTFDVCCLKGAAQERSPGFRNIAAPPKISVEDVPEFHRLVRKASLIHTDSTDDSFRSVSFADGVIERLGGVVF